MCFAVSVDESQVIQRKVIYITSLDFHLEGNLNMANEEQAVAKACGVFLTEEKQRQRSLCHPPDFLVGRGSCFV